MTQTAMAFDPGAPLAGVRKAKIILLSTVAAISYGVVHDQITARLCIEYFTIGHPPLFHTTSPTVLGICWGITATVGVGALLGVILALVSQSKGRPPTAILRVFKSVLGLLAVMAVSASLAGVVGFELSRRSMICIPATLADLVPPSQQHRFMAVWFAHGASYARRFSRGFVHYFANLAGKRPTPRPLGFSPHQESDHPSTDLGLDCRVGCMVPFCQVVSRVARLCSPPSRLMVAISSIAALLLCCARLGIIIPGFCIGGPLFKRAIKSGKVS